MPKVTFKDDFRSVQIETEKPISLYDSMVQAFLLALHSLEGSASLRSFDAEERGSLVYSYEFETSDKRRFRQEIDFRDGVRMTFDVPSPGWRTEEFVPHRAVRDAFIKLVRDAQLKSIRVRYGATQS